MAQTDLLTVERVFQLQDIGLTVLPDFLVPKAGRKNGTHRVRVVNQMASNSKLTPTSMSGISTFAIHLQPPDERWRVVISFPSLTKDDLPTRSRILGDPTMAATLL